MSTSAFAKGPKIYSTYVYKNKLSSFEELLVKEMSLPKKFVYKTGYLKRIYTWNKVSSFINKELEQVYIEVPYKYKDKVQAYKKNFQFQDENERLLASAYQERLLNGKEKSQKTVIIDKTIANLYDDLKPDQRFNLIGFYSLSNGDFKETIGSEVEATSTQNSPVTLGVMSKIKSTTNERVGYSLSLYFSKLDGGVASNSDKVNIPLEYGSNFYWDYRYNSKFNFYSGLDLERFSTFNIEDLNQGEDLRTREQMITYVTLGLSSNFIVKDKRFFYKASVSQSIFSQSNVNDGNYSGNKLMLFLTAHVYKNIFASAFYKQHLLSGLSELSVSRYGFGIGYRFF